MLSAQNQTLSFDSPAGAKDAAAQAAEARARGEAAARAAAEAQVATLRALLLQQQQHQAPAPAQEASEELTAELRRRKKQIVKLEQVYGVLKQRLGGAWTEEDFNALRLQVRAARS